MYDTDQGNVQVARHRIPPAKLRHDSVPQRKAHPALANIVVSVTRGAPATCYLPDTVDPQTRRLIAVQLCDEASIVPAVFLARAATTSRPTSPSTPSDICEPTRRRPTSTTPHRDHARWGVAALVDCCWSTCCDQRLALRQLGELQQLEPGALRM